MLAAVAQICSLPSLTHNVALCRSVIRRAAQAGADLVWLPEASDFIASAADVPGLSRPLDQSVFIDGVKVSRKGVLHCYSGYPLEDVRRGISIQAQAKFSKVWVGVGVHESVKGEERCCNTNLLISPEGEVRAAYRKIHLFDVDIRGGTVILESKTTKPGAELFDPVETPLGKVGLLTCYDLRFPEVSLALRRRGAQIITYPSAFTLRTEVLLRARAIETQSYILAPAQTGSHTATRQSYGHAMIVGPWGEVLAQCSDRQPKPYTDGVDDGTFAMADLDLGWLEDVRRDMPLWEQRRSDVYPIL
ncbi:BZ3500_MvSof-1268-A1-R1_Chr1-3g01883 [Microbotryum saponariae]|uniref:BZ3500_MvSof-1268-A1-R1_Chr1-3g01883 protein n=1 Tax=Microbotryum saponariae TaxID=289078 RepID=A0A2X0KPE1_9BASI|nr:BZ3500_MvSof-1268-A1-R1_Chr1-3g01883 [Microbotryum saponariae]SCZ94817.1 BZ3501_MvSof-1269-A2-R1_Chr1-3g01485 [Microbotryum saponariae]